MKLHFGYLRRWRGCESVGGEKIPAVLCVLCGEHNFLGERRNARLERNMRHSEFLWRYAGILFKNRNKMT